MSNIRSKTRTRISYATGAGSARTPMGVIGAVLVHGLIVASALFTFTHRLDIVDESAPIVPVELVTIGTKTNITPTVRELPKKEEIEPPQQDVPPPEAKAEEVPEPVPSEPVIQKKPATPLPTPKTPPKPEKKTAQDDFAALLNKLTAPQKAPNNVKLADRTTKGIGSMNAMTMELADGLRNQIAQCWNAPAAGPHPEQMIVDVRMFLNPDGTVARAPQLTADSAADAARSSFTRAAADAALRAINVCAPYKLPSDRYTEWRDITVTFDPRKMAGL